MSSAPKCDVCDEIDATVHCALCNMHLCAADDADIHKPAKFASHQRKPINEAGGMTAAATAVSADAPAAAVTVPQPASSASAPAPSLCAICDTDPATLACAECDQQHCDPCSAELHKPARLAGHSRTPVSAAAAQPPSVTRAASSARGRLSARGGSAAPSAAKASPDLPPAPASAAASSPVSKPAEPTLSPPSAAAASPAASVPVPAAIPAAVCDMCEAEPATIACDECAQQHCEPCSVPLHKPARLSSHTRRPIGAAAAQPPKAARAPSSARDGPAAPSTAKASPGLPPTPTPVAASSPVSKPAQSPSSARSAAAATPAPASVPVLAAVPAAVCDMCEAEPATISCDDCAQSHCDPCSVGLHKPARLAGHSRKPIGSDATAAPKAASTSARGKATVTSGSTLPPASTVVAATAPTSKPADPPAATPAAAPTAAALCDLCESDPSTVACDECDQQHCEPCSVDLHKPARLAGHSRKPIGSAAAPSTAPAVARRTSARSAAATPSTPQQQSQQPQSKPKPEEEKEPSSPPPAAASKPAPVVAAAVAPRTVRPSSAKPASSTAASSPAAKPASSSAWTEAAATPASPAPAAPAPAAKPRAMSASRSASALRSAPSSQGRPRSAMPARSSDGTSSAASLLSGAPRSLQQSLSPTRSVLSMSYGSRWVEPDLRPYKGERAGTFGSTNRDGSPKRDKNLLYSKSASDLIGSGSHSEGASAAHWNRLSRPKVFVSSVISPLFDDVRECSFAPRINPLSSSIAPGQFHERLAKSVDGYVTRALRTDGGSLPPGATFQPQLNKSKSAGRLSNAATAAAATTEAATAASAESPSSHSSSLSSSRAEFLARMASDAEKRRQNAALLASQSLCSFTPTISESSKKRTARIKTPFLERLAEDLTGRDDGAAMRAADAARLPFSFQPNPDRLGSTHYSFDTFLRRMEGDLEGRKEKYEERCRMFGIPSPEECVALTKTGSASETHRSGGSSTRR